ncbi:hypothetical protein [Burkholderia gladioli]|uniref:hypothetical protein n=1 Tax=Burkholderia gladioli TaxID=28095 RepID=UPI0016418821|nr:hypothetical protein [Burkholderia gladioli]
MIEAQTDTLPATIDTSSVNNGYPASLSISPDGQQLYVANGQADFPSHQNGLFVVDVATLAVTRSLPAPDDVFSFTNSGVAQDGYRILFNPSYTAAGQTGLLSLDPAENRISARVLLPAGANWSSGLAVVAGNRACATAR